LACSPLVAGFAFAPAEVVVLGVPELDPQALSPTAAAAAMAGRTIRFTAVSS